MIVLLLANLCNNRCLFCRDDRANQNRYIDFDRLCTFLKNVKKGTEIDLFSDEPTLYPYFFELLEYSRSSDLKISLATNARLFADKRFTERVSKIGLSNIRTSILGDTDTIHDYHTQIRGSFKQTISGIKNIIDNEIELYVNTVITKENYEHLLGIVNLVNNLGVKHQKFSSIVNGNHCLDIIPSNLLVRPYLDNAMKKCIQLRIRPYIEKSPICIAPNYYSFNIQERDKSIYTFDTICQYCMYFPVCNGVPREQILLYGNKILLPELAKNKIINHDLILSSKISEGDNRYLSWEDDYHLNETKIIYNFDKVRLNQFMISLDRKPQKKTLVYLKVRNSNDINIINSVINSQKNNNIEKENIKLLFSLQSNEDVNKSLSKLETLSNCLSRFSWAFSCDNSVSMIELFTEMIKISDDYVNIEILTDLDNNPNFFDESLELFDLFDEKILSCKSKFILPSFNVKSEEELAYCLKEKFNKWILVDNPKYEIIFFEDILSQILGNQTSGFENSLLRLIDLENNKKIEISLMGDISIITPSKRINQIDIYERSDAFLRLAKKTISNCIFET